MKARITLVPLYCTRPTTRQSVISKPPSQELPKREPASIHRYSFVQRGQNFSQLPMRISLGSFNRDKLSTTTPFLASAQVYGQFPGPFPPFANGTVHSDPLSLHDNFFWQRLRLCTSHRDIPGCFYWPQTQWDSPRIFVLEPSSGSPGEVVATWRKPVSRIDTRSPSGRAH